MAELTLWDFLSARGENVILRWVKDARLTPRDRAALNQKLDRLRQMDFDLAIGTKLLAGPIEKQRHIYKLVIHGDVMLRPLLSRGPIDPEAEYTLLLGAIERGGKLPKDAPQQAEDNRLIVLDDPPGGYPMSESRDILKEEFQDKEYRHAYAEDFLNTKIAAQIRVLREQRGWTQADLADRIGTKQAGVSRLENVNYSGWKIETLKKIARAFDMTFNGGFESFGKLLDEAEKFSRETLEKPSFENDPGFYAREAASAKVQRLAISNLYIDQL